MIDLGATHNFISQSLVDDLKLPITERSYGIIMGLRPPLKGKRVCKGVVLNLGELTVIECFLPLALAGVDVVLGMLWLHTLGETRVNWSTLTIKIEKGKDAIVLKGDPSLTEPKVSLKKMMKTWNECDQGYLVEFKTLTAVREENDFEFKILGEYLTVAVKQLIQD